MERCKTRTAEQRDPRTSKYTWSGTRNRVRWEALVALLLLTATPGPAANVARVFAQGSVTVREYVQPPLNSEQAFLQALRERGFDRLAEQYCRERLKNSQDLPAESKAVYVLVLSDIVVSRINQTADVAERDKLWEEAISALEGFLETHREGVHVPSVRYQLAAIELARAQEARLRSLVSPERDTLRQLALERLQRVRTILDQVEGDIDTVIRSLGREESPRYYPVLESIRIAAHLLRARAELEAAEIYSWGSPERLAAATRAIESADRARAATTGPAGPGQFIQQTAEALLVKARAAILAGRYQVAESALNELHELQEKTDKVPVRYLDAALVERVRMEAARYEWDKAYRLAKDSLVLLQTDQPELYLLLLESCLRLAIRRDAVVSERFLREAVEVTETIGQKFGPYWKQRAAGVLAEYLQSPQLVRDPEILLAAGLAFQAKGDSERAMAFLDRAARVAGSRSDLRARALLAMCDALLASGKLEQAARNLEELSRALGPTPEGAAALLKAANCYAHLYSRDKDAKWLEAYETALRSLIERHGQRPEAVRARWLLARLLEHRRQWTDAARLYRDIVAADDAELSAEANRRAAVAYRNAVEAAWAAGEQPDSLLSEAAGFLEARARNARNRGDLSLARELVTALVRLYSSPHAGRYELAVKAAEILPREQVYGPGPADELRSSLLVALLKTGKVPEAEALAENLQFTDPNAALQLLDQLNALTTTEFHAAIRRAIGEIELRLIDRIPQNNLDERQRTRLAVFRGMALALAGRHTEARRLFEQIADRLNRDPQAMVAYARILSSLEQWEAARDAWRRAAARLRPGDPEFFEARFGLAEACLKSGDPEQALKIIELTELLHPSLGGPAWKQRFTQLKAEAVFQRKP